jgi:hypothetical protein
VTMTWPLAGSLLAWACATFLALARRPQGASGWYRLSGLIQGFVAVMAGIGTREWSWIGLGMAWAVVKGVIIPLWLTPRVKLSPYSVKTSGTPRLMIGAVGLLSVLWWALGIVGIPVGVTLVAFWLIGERRELWVEALLLVEAEIGTGFLTLMTVPRPGTADLLVTVELLALGGLLWWFHRASHRLFSSSAGLATDDLTALQG